MKIFGLKISNQTTIRLCHFTGISIERSWTVADAEGDSPGNETTTILNDISSCDSSTLNESDKT